MKVTSKRLPASSKKSKYKNVKVEIDGIKFASKKEGQRYLQLKLLERAGEITGLELQKRFPLHCNEVKVCNYICDFYYLDRKGDQWTVEDTKGYKTDIYNLKKKMMKAQYGIEIFET